MPKGSQAATFTCRGHPAIAGTHTKTLEFTRDADVTRRATCVLGVASDHDNATLLRLRGDVDVTIECGDARDALRATITPFFLGDDSLVIRRGPALHDRTLAGNATKAASDVDRALIAAIGARDAQVRVTIEPTGRNRGRGALFVVSLPIGNDDDLSPRARRVLEAVDHVLAEDTRRFRDFTRRAQVDATDAVTSLHEHNESGRVDDAIVKLANGDRIALVSDAGTPLCSDPGYLVVERAVAEGFAVTPVPGPSSLLAVVSASGLPVDRFTYVGFFARRSAARRSAIAELVARRETFVCHEAPHRVVSLGDDLAAVAPDWRVCVGREVTKIFEEFVRSTAAELPAQLQAAEPRGEYTLVVAPPADDGPAPEGAAALDVDAIIRALLDEGVSARSIAKALGAQPGLTRKAVYARVLELADND